jgi:hypothetical protein
MVFRFPEGGDHEHADATSRYPPDPANEQSSPKWFEAASSGFFVPGKDFVPRQIL